MLTRTSLLALLLTCPTALALGQDTPTSKPAAPPAGAAVAQAIVKLRAAKLTQRLTTPRHFKMVRKNGIYRLRLGGAETKTGLTLTSRVSTNSRPDHHVEYTYRIGATGLLTGLEVMQVLQVPGGKIRRQGYVGVVRGSLLVVRGAEDGKLHSSSFGFPWSDRVLPTSFLWFVVPSLFDQGLPTVLEPEVFTEEKVRPGYKPQAVQFTRTRESSSTPAGRVHTLRMSGRPNRDATTITIAAIGPQAGQVLRVQIDHKRVFTAITAKDYVELGRTAQRERREAIVANFLKGLHYTQGVYKRNKGAFAASFEQLQALDKRFPARLAQVETISKVTLRAAKDGSGWLAVAAPGPTSTHGERHLVINADGKVHASKTPIVLNDAGTMPAGVTPFR